MICGLLPRFCHSYLTNNRLRFITCIVNHAVYTVVHKQQTLVSAHHHHLRALLALLQPRTPRSSVWEAEPHLASPTYASDLPSGVPALGRARLTPPEASLAGCSPRIRPLRACVVKTGSLDSGSQSHLCLSPHGKPSCWWPPVSPAPWRPQGLLCLALDRRSVNDE